MERDEAGQPAVRFFCCGAAQTRAPNRLYFGYDENFSA